MRSARTTPVFSRVAPVLGTLAVIGLVASACTGETPQFTQGTSGNAIQIFKPPVEVPPFDSGPRAFTESCFSTPAAMNCPVSFTNDIYPKMESAGEWKCAAGGCHGGSTPPAIDEGNAAGTYNSLVAWTSEALGAYYITPCAGNDPSQSSILCNLSPSGTCSNLMPLGSGGATLLTPDELKQLATWIACGAPLN